MPPQRKRRRVDRAHADVRCDRCQLLFSDQGLRELNAEPGLLHHSRRSLLTSSEAGCALCLFILDLASSQFRDSWGPNDSLVFQNIRQGTGSRPSSPGIQRLRGTVEGSNNFITICPFAKQGDPAAALVCPRPLRRDVRSDSVFAAARKLIHDCLGPDDGNMDRPKARQKSRQKSHPQGHQECRYSRDTVLPTRVLDVGDNENPAVRLKVNETETHGAYLALSYCWGPESQPVQLKKDNIQSLTSEIKLDDRQKSIQDAITATRKLGFKYLWVDALCIIQDDKEDKNREISGMASIYKNAAVTLAAATAKKASEGFLGDSRPKIKPYLPDHKFGITMDKGQVGTIYLSAEAYTPEHHLDTRGWTLQEFMLSTRKLIFSTYEVLWQCERVELRSVKGPHRGLDYQQTQETLPWTGYLEDAEPHDGTLDSEKRYAWKTIVRQYTHRNLSKPEDRLDAVKGITSELEKLWEDSIIHGHWRKWFVELLAWFKPSEQSRVEKRCLERAPSWSWASLDGVIHCEEPLESQDAQVKILTVGEVTLDCRVLAEDDVSRDELDSVEERPDLRKRVASKELGDKDCRYLLLGIIGTSDGRKRGVGLMILPVANGLYRRLGLVIFFDLAIWDDVGRQLISFEGKK